MRLQTPTLKAPLATLRPVTAEDAEVLLQVMRDPEVLKLTGSTNSSQSDGGLSLEATREWYGSRSSQDDRIDWAIVDNSSGDVVGEAVLNEYDAGSQSVGFRMLIGPKGRNRGIGSEVVRMVVDHALVDLKLHRVELEVYAFNPRARRVYEKSGFVLEGTRRQALLFDGEWVDAHVMAVLAGES